MQETKTSLQPMDDRTIDQRMEEMMKKYKDNPPYLPFYEGYKSQIIFRTTTTNHTNPVTPWVPRDWGYDR